ncbi:MAG TPA: rubredoxin [Nitrospirota bacterium]|nr:rubredoxin [Nitrospirota bacterium]
MDVSVEKIPGGFSVDGLELKNGKCGCTTVLPCCYSWSKIKRSGNAFAYVGKASSPDSKENFNWSYAVKKGDHTVEVNMEDARDKKIFSGYYPPRIEEWTEKGWEVVKKEGVREDFNLWRCPACRWLYKEQVQKVLFESLPDDWKCPVCKVGKESFERVA